MMWDEVKSRRVFGPEFVHLIPLDQGSILFLSTWSRSRWSGDLRAMTSILGLAQWSEKKLRLDVVGRRGGLDFGVNGPPLNLGLASPNCCRIGFGVLQFDARLPSIA